MFFSMKTVFPIMLEKITIVIVFLYPYLAIIPIIMILFHVPLLIMMFPLTTIISLSLPLTTILILTMMLLKLPSLLIILSLKISFIPLRILKHPLDTPLTHDIHLLTSKIFIPTQ